MAQVFLFVFCCSGLRFLFLFDDIYRSRLSPSLAAPEEDQIQSTFLLCILKGYLCVFGTPL